jgi:acyl carrier protein
MDNWHKLRAIIATVLRMPEEQVTAELSAEGVDTWDSLNHISIIGAVEQEFGITLPTENLGAFMSVAQLKSLLAERGVAF